MGEPDVAGVLELGDGTWISPEMATTRVRGGGFGSGAWLALIGGTHPVHGLARRFITADKSGMSGSGRSGSVTWDLPGAGLYEWRDFCVGSTAGNWRSSGYAVISDTAVREVTKAEAAALARQLDGVTKVRISLKDPDGTWWEPDTGAALTAALLAAASQATLGTTAPEDRARMRQALDVLDVALGRYPGGERPGDDGRPSLTDLDLARQPLMDALGGHPDVTVEDAAGQLLVVLGAYIRRVLG